MVFYGIQKCRTIAEVKLANGKYTINQPQNLLPHLPFCLVRLRQCQTNKPGWKRKVREAGTNGNAEDEYHVI